MISIYPVNAIWALEIGGKYFLNMLYTNLKTFCRGQVDRIYIMSLMADSDWVIVSTTGETVRGFAFLKRMNSRSLYLHLICAAIAHPMRRRSGLVDNVGGDMLRYIQDFCKIRRFSRIILHALGPVITLYHKFGWRFVNRINQREKPAITEAVDSLTREIVDIRKSDISLDKIDVAVSDFIDKSNKDIHSSWFLSS